MALTSWPAPSHMPLEEEFGLEFAWWAGARLGNTQTCNAQGFFFNFGVSTQRAYEGALCGYYACVIVFRMHENTIRKRVEPVLHIWAIGGGLLLALLPLSVDLYNPVLSQLWCFSMPYPQMCLFESSGVECIRGSKESHRIFVLALISRVSADVIVIVVCLLLIVWKVISIDRQLAFYEKTLHRLYRRSAEVALSIVEIRQQSTKAVLLQSCAYGMVFVVSLLFPILSKLSVSANRRAVWEVLSTIFDPLHGFFNFLIFIGHKVYNYRKVNTDKSICQALNKLFCTSEAEPMFISRIAMVKDDHNVQIYLEDELGEHVEYVIRYAGAAASAGNDVFATGSVHDLSGFEDAYSGDSASDQCGGGGGGGTKEQLNKSGSKFDVGDGLEMQVSSPFAARLFDVGDGSGMAVASPLAAGLAYESGDENDRTGVSTMTDMSFASKGDSSL